MLPIDSNHSIRTSSQNYGKRLVNVFEGAGMGNITVEFADGFLIATTTGTLSYDEVIAAFVKYAPLVVRHIVVNMGDSTIVDLSGDQVRALPKVVKKHLVNRKDDGRTAFVCAQDCNFGMTRMYAISAELTGTPYRYNTFKTVAEALEWLQER